MGPWYYEVVSFDGDYVNLRRTDIESDELNPVALALLPPEIDVGSKLKCEYFQYEIIGCQNETPPVRAAFLHLLIKLYALGHQLEACLGEFLPDLLDLGVVAGLES